MLPYGLDITRCHNTQTCCHPCSLFEVVRIGLSRKDLLQGVLFAVFPVAINVYTKIGSLTSTHPHQPLLIQGIHLPCRVGDAKSKRKAITFENTPWALKQKRKGN